MILTFTDHSGLTHPPTPLDRVSRVRPQRSPRPTPPSTHHGQLHMQLNERMHLPRIRMDLCAALISPRRCVCLHLRIPFLHTSLGMPLFTPYLHCTIHPSIHASICIHRCAYACTHPLLELHPCIPCAHPSRLGAPRVYVDKWMSSSEWSTPSTHAHMRTCPSMRTHMHPSIHRYPSIHPPMHMHSPVPIWHASTPPSVHTTRVDWVHIAYVDQCVCGRSTHYGDVSTCPTPCFCLHSRCT